MPKQIPDYKALSNLFKKTTRFETANTCNTATEYFTSRPNSLQDQQAGNPYQLVLWLHMLSLSLPLLLFDEAVSTSESRRSGRSAAGILASKFRSGSAAVPRGLPHLLVAGMVGGLPVFVCNHRGVHTGRKGKVVAQRVAARELDEAVRSLRRTLRRHHA